MGQNVRKPSQNALNLAHIFTSQRIDVTLDVGANLGQFAQSLWHAGWQGRVVSFEPVVEVNEALLHLASNHDGPWEVVEPVALGDQDGELTLLVSPERDMSSALSLLPAAAHLLDSAVPTHSQTVQMRRIDGIFEKYVRPDERVALKIDTQGTELKVLSGAAGVIDRIDVLHIELALVPAYTGEPDWQRVIEKISKLGFVPALFIPGYFNRRTARLFSMDGVFVRPELERSFTATRS